MKSAGEILKTTRLKKGLTLKDISSKTKIGISFLQAIEDRDYKKLPSSTYAKGFVRSYAQSLGLDIKHIMAFFRREYQEAMPEIKIPPQPINTPVVAVTPGKIITFFVSITIIIFLGILFWQYRSFAGTPVLLINSPQDKITIEKPFVSVVGRTDEQTQVFVNGEEIKVSSEGVFEETVNLNKGLNTIRIVARNKVGKESVAERVVEVRNIK